MLDFGPGSFFLTPTHLLDSPSFRHGVSADTEKVLRIYACEIIQEAGILLRLPQAVAATAQVLFHRFFCKQSFCDFDARSAAASCFWLSMKLEEEEGASNRGRKHSQLNDVVHTFEHIRARREGTQPLRPHAPGFKIRKEELLKLETRILAELGFVCHVEHPHKLMLGYLNCLDASKDLIQESWNLVNDSLRTTICVCYASNVVACGVIYAAARRVSVPLPENPPWWALFDVTSDQIRSVCEVLADLYRQPKSHFIDVKAPTLKPVALTSSKSVEPSSVASPITSAESLPCPRGTDSNCAKSADVFCSNNNPVITPSSASKILNSCFLNAPGCPPSKDLARDDHHSQLSSSEGKKSPRESTPGESERKSSKRSSSHDRAYDRKRYSHRTESVSRDAYREPERKHRRWEDYSRCSRYSNNQASSARHNYGHVRG